MIIIINVTYNMQIHRCSRCIMSNVACITAHVIRNIFNFSAVSKIQTMTCPDDVQQATTFMQQDH